MSHPMRVRGLKREITQAHELTVKSHPMRVRGLKPILDNLSIIKIGVAPHAGAWIETRL